MQSVSGLSGGYQQLIDSIILSEKSPQLRLEQKKSDLNVYKGVLTDLDTKLSDLESALETFTSATSNPFEASTAATAEGSAFSVTSGSDAALGTHTLAVDRLAQTDTRVSQQYTATGTDLAATGAQAFDITVASPTEDAPDNRETITVSVNPTGSTNEEVLEEIAASINTAMANAVDDGTLESSQKAQASVVMESSGTLRLSLRSGQTGYTNRLELSGGLLDTLDITANDTTTDDDSGGQIYDVGTSATDSMLNSQFVLDGLTLYRDSNSVDDALDDVTLNLQQADSTQQSFSIETDSESIKKDVEGFIKKFNDVQKYLKEKTKVDPESDTRGAFAGEGAIRALRYNLRNDAVDDVTGLPDDAPATFTEVGIELTNNGTLELSDADTLLEAAETNPSALKDLFGGENGLATRMLQKVEGYTGAGGIVSERKQTVDSRIGRIDDKVARFESRLERRREQLTEQFARVQRIQQESFSQQQALAGFFGGFGF
jgi:flagellar hook-associated protein 2